MLIEHATILNEHQIMSMLWFSVSMIACSISIRILSYLMVVKYGTMLVKNQKLLRPAGLGWVPEYPKSTPRVPHTDRAKGWG